MMGGVRLVSLLPSATEIVYALGLGDDLVGVTFECDEPAAARREKVVVVGGRDTRGMAPGEIDDYVKAQLAAGGDLYTLHADALAGLGADLILTQDLCRVCALPSGHVEEALDHLGCRADVVSLDPYTLDEVFGTFLAVADAAEVPERGQALVAALRERMDRVAAAVAGRPRRRVALVEWVEPPFTAGHWVPDLVRAAGGEAVAARPGRKSVEVTWVELAAGRPEVVIVTPCGFHLDGAAEQAVRGGAAFSRRRGVGDRRRRSGGPARPAAGRRRRGDGGDPAPGRGPRTVGGGDSAGGLTRLNRRREAGGHQQRRRA
jgi:iron complex transport system substrate-binding protein